MAASLAGILNDNFIIWYFPEHNSRPDEIISFNLLNVNVLKDLYFNLFILQFIKLAVEKKH